MKAESTIRVWAIFGHYIPNFSGSAVQGKQIMDVLADRGYTFEVLAAADHLAANLAGQKMRQNKISIRYIPVIRRRGWQVFQWAPRLQKVFRYLNGLLNSLSFSLRCAITVWREGQSGEVVHLHSVNDFSCLVVWLANRRGMHPVLLMTLMGSDDPRSVRGLAGKMKACVYNRLQALVSLCSAMSESCRVAGLDENRVVTIPCAVDTERFHPVSTLERERICRQLGLDPDRHFIIFAGAALYRKGIDVLVKAFTEIADEIPDVDLLVVGPWDFSDHSRHPADRKQLVQELRVQLARSNLTARTHWTGEVENVEQYMQISSVFCFPTRREGFGIVIIEAMASGLPCVVARLEGVTTDIIPDDRYGILIPGDHPTDYATALQRFLNQPALAETIGRAARQRSTESFRLEIVAEQFGQLYKQLTEEHFA